MQDLKQKSSKKPKRQFANQSAVEALESVVGGLRESLVNDMGKGTAKTLKESVIKDLGSGGVNEMWNELLHVDTKQSSKSHEKTHESNQGELSEGAELDLGSLQKNVVEITEMGRQFRSEVINAGKRAEDQNSQEVQIKMQEILIEIKKLSESSSELKEQVEVISLEQTGEDIGIYHVNFLEKMLSFISELRLNVEDSLAWFSSLRSKKAARQYKSMSKKHGTSYSLSSERQVSTQVG